MSECQFDGQFMTVFVNPVKFYGLGNFPLSGLPEPAETVLVRFLEAVRDQQVDILSQHFSFRIPEYPGCGIVPQIHDAFTVGTDDGVTGIQKYGFEADFTFPDIGNILTDTENTPGLAVFVPQVGNGDAEINRATRPGRIYPFNHSQKSVFKQIPDAVQSYFFQNIMPQYHRHRLPYQFRGFITECVQCGNIGIFNHPMIVQHKHQVRHGLDNILQTIPGLLQFSCSILNQASQGVEQGLDPVLPVTDHAGQQTQQEGC